MEENKEKIQYQISPKFNFLYELGMPTGRKIKTALLMIVILLVLNGFLWFGGDIVTAISVPITETLTVLNILQYISLFALILGIITFIFRMVFQYLQYRHIRYTFYEDHLVYEDDFLNQHRKNIEYNNIKEVEIRRKVWDRILGYGVIIIYTNAENKRSNGMVIYGIKDPKTSYEVIDTLVNRVKHAQREEEPDIYVSSTDEREDKKEIVDEEKSNDSQKESEIVSEEKKTQE